ncbi:hypothetical protein M9H77_15869 [Catharanthus roseus]|uniref:Uncharacterized protein n=1 Tax=Catharanthus roseus TaxID=4058 RepID=A0ACC0B152_CATRO|nr:hypothetical protein M9H77_15869 [Catharanthus roseus]
MARGTAGRDIPGSSTGTEGSLWTQLWAAPPKNEKIEELKNIAATLNETEVPSEDDWDYDEGYNCND